MKSRANLFEQISYDKGAALSDLIQYIGMRNANYFFLAIVASIPNQISTRFENDWFGFNRALTGLDLLSFVKKALIPEENGFIAE